MTDAVQEVGPTAGPPVPSTISAEAQAVLEQTANLPATPSPAWDDDAGWQTALQWVTARDPQTAEALALVTTAAVVTDASVEVEERSAEGARYFIATPEGLDPTDDRVLLFIHGGGFIAGGGDVARLSTQLIAGSYGVQTWGLDYRELPDDPFPAGLDDCLAVYRALLGERPARAVAIAGQSGGANLSAALLLRAHAEGLPLPAAAGLISPPTDLSESGDTYRTNSFSVSQGGLTDTFRRYAAGQPLDHPYLSPLFGDWTADFPPIILTAGTRDFLLSDVVRLHRRLVAAGVRTELHVWEAAPHGMFMGRAPEDREQVAQVRTFLERAWRDASVD